MSLDNFKILIFIQGVLKIIQIFALFRQNYNIRTNLKFGKFVPKNFQKISFLKILENCFQYSTTRHVCPMIEESIMEHTCLPDDRVDQRGISHMSVIKLNSVSFHKLIYLLNTFTLEKIDFAIKV